jgi:hypothetical protein
LQDRRYTSQGPKIAREGYDNSDPVIKSAVVDEVIKRRSSAGTGDKKSLLKSLSKPQLSKLGNSSIGKEAIDTLLDKELKGDGK